MPILSRTFRSRVLAQGTFPHTRATETTSAPSRGQCEVGPETRLISRAWLIGFWSTGGHRFGKDVESPERMSTATTIPWYSVDDLTWEPGWKPVAEDEQRATDCRDLRGRAVGRWTPLMACGSTFRSHGVQVIVALDFPRWLSLLRLIRRSVARAIDGSAICNGDRESFRLPCLGGLDHRVALQVIWSKAPPHPESGRPTRAGQ